MQTIPLTTLLWALSLSPLLAQDLGYQINGPSTGSDFGAAICGIGDLNGDGLGDFVVGAPRDGRNGLLSGCVRLYSGQDGSLLLEILGDAPGHRFGHRLAGLGDVNGDGIPDFAVSAARDNALGLTSGYVRILSGANGATLQGFSTSSTWDHFGDTLVALGDLDGDGVRDLLVGSPHENWQGPGSGAVRVFSSATGKPLHLLFGDATWDLFGFSACLVPDLDNDGTDEFAVGAPHTDPMGSESGSVFVFSGRTGSRMQQMSGQPIEGFGYGMTAGDFDADGQPEIAISGLNDFSSLIQRIGFLEVRNLSGNASLNYRIEAADRFEGFGTTVTGIGDLNGDGFSDFAVGAPFSQGSGQGGVAVGVARIYIGLGGRELTSHIGSVTSDKLGSAMAAAGDLNGDGLDDYLIGEPGDNPAGAVYAFFSRATPKISIQGASAGNTATLSLSQGLADSPISAIYSLRGFGVTGFPSGITLDLASPIAILGSFINDASGQGSISFPVPPGTTGLQAWIQAWQLAGPPPGIGTNTLHLTIT